MQKTDSCFKLHSQYKPTGDQPQAIAELENDLDIKPIAKNEEHFRKWSVNYPFYANIEKEGVVLYEAA